MPPQEPPARPELTIVSGTNDTVTELTGRRQEEVPERLPDAIVLLLSGPNLNLLGQRQPEIYGRDTLADHVAKATMAAAEHGLALEHVQSDYEGALIEAVHEARGRAAAIVVNPGALTHYSWSLQDALATFEGPIVELHISNPKRREPWRHVSVVSPVATGVIAGFGGDGYRLAIEAVAAILRAVRHSR
ncbi:MAG TPA: type II 3-dehydroquinate dehydratase [Acidimicrobiales bacterium]|nr:type II 3-dehydroquinate dehydratase [Acidimicrobiales bacterium]